MLLMFCGCLTKHEDIVQVDHAHCVKPLAQHSIHQSLERTGRVDKAKGHHGVLKEAPTALKGRIVLVAFRDPHLVIACPEVYGRKVARTMQAIEKIIYSWDGVPVNQCIGIESAIVHAHAHGSIFLADE